MLKRLFWFLKTETDKDYKVIEEEVERLKQDNEYLQESLEKSKTKSDIVDLLGDIEQVKELSSMGTIDSIIKKLNDYDRVQDLNKKLLEEVKKLRSQTAQN